MRVATAVLLQTVSIRPDGAGATHQTSIEGSAEVGLSANSAEFVSQAKAAVRKARRANGRSRRSGVSAFAVPFPASIVREGLRHGGWKSDLLRGLHAQRLGETSR